MITGAIREGEVLRSVVAQLATHWKGLPIYVGCSGNFTIERVVHRALKSPEIHSQDVSLFSCALGKYLAGEPMTLKIREAEKEQWDWLEPYIGEPVAAIATLMISGDLFNAFSRPELYYKRMARAIRDQFPDQHMRTMPRVIKALEGVKLASFLSCDALDFARSVPDTAVMVSLPPITQPATDFQAKVFEWDAPGFQAWSTEKLAAYQDEIRSKGHWLIFGNKQNPELDQYWRAMIQTGVRTDPVYVWASDGATQLITPHQIIKPVPWPRMEDELRLPLQLVKLENGQMNLLRSIYLSPKIAPADALYNVGILSDGRLLGAFSFSAPTYLGGWCDAYGMTDFAVRPTCYRRLAKLVLSVMLSKEVKSLMEQKIRKRIVRIGTSAFTEKGASMKYRGLFEVYNRKDGVINYQADAGRWSLDEGVQNWLKFNSQRFDHDAHENPAVLTLSPLPEM